MSKYRTKPGIEIEAIQFTGRNAFEIFRFLGHGPDVLGNMELKDTDSPTIKTLEGDMTAAPGDYIIKGTRGEFYPCKPDVFARKYEAVEEDAGTCPFDRFCNELDALVQRWRDKPEDDRLSHGQVVGALAFCQHNLIADARDDHAAGPES